MIIEEIINELDKFITKYKERKDVAEKGASLRNNIKQALTEKGIQGADMLDDGAIVERIKTLNSNSDTAVGQTQNNNNPINETFAQKVINILKENNFPYLNSEEDNLEEFKKYALSKKEEIVDVTSLIEPIVKEGSVHVVVTPKNGQGIKVRYTESGEQKEETVKSKKEFANITEFKYQPCDYYGVAGTVIEKQLYLDVFEKQLNRDGITFEFEKYSSGNYTAKSIVDNNDYDILDSTKVKTYSGILAEEIKKRFDGGILNENYDSYLKTLQYNGIIKIFILNDMFGNNLFGFRNLENDPFKNKPKHIVLSNTYSPSSAIYINTGVSYYIDFDSINSEAHDKIEKTKTAIYRWDSTKNKYTFESADTLEDWLKEHPLDTL